MATWVEPVTRGGGVKLFRATGAGDRRLRVTVDPGPRGSSQTYLLSRGVDVLDIPGYGTGVGCEVTVRPASLPAQLRLGSQEIRLRTESRPFRVLISGSGRCGTKSLAGWLDGMSFTDGTRVVARHESLAAYVLRGLVEGDRDTIAQVVAGQGHNVESSPFYALAVDQLQAGQIVHLVRDGRQVVKSGMNRGWYVRNHLWNDIKPHFTDDAFTNSCHYWRHTNAEMERVADRRVRLEDLATDTEARARLLSDLQIEANDKPFPCVNESRQTTPATVWTEDMRRSFAEICGPLMGRYYPGWEEGW